MSDLSRAEFDDLMQRNDFVIDTEGYVVCNLCSANCGQCGVGQHQSRCQTFYDAHRTTENFRQFKMRKRLSATRAWYKRVPKPSLLWVVLIAALLFDGLTRLGELWQH